MQQTKNQVRRRLRNVTFDGERGIVTAQIYSFTQPSDPGDRKDYTVRMECRGDKQVSCECDDFQYRKAKRIPTVLDDPEKLFCKHLRRLREYVIRYATERGLIGPTADSSGTYGRAVELQVVAGGVPSPATEAVS